MEERFRKKWHEWAFGHKEKEKWNDECKQKEQLKQIRSENKEKEENDVLTPETIRRSLLSLDVKQYCELRAQARDMHSGKQKEKGVDF